jgi:hypothetical protein
MIRLNTIIVPTFSCLADDRIAAIATKQPRITTSGSELVILVLSEEKRFDVHDAAVGIECSQPHKVIASLELRVRP